MKRYGWIGLLLGIWLLIAPFAIGAARLAAVGADNNVALFGNDILIGLLLVTTSGWVLFTPDPPATLGSFQVLCGAWLIVSGLILYGALPAAMLNDLAAGALTIALGLAELQTLFQPPDWVL
jgi:hypothetical protein